MRTVKLALGFVFGLGVLFTGVMGFAHTRPGQPLLRLLGRVYSPSSASCPLGYDKQATPEQKDAARKRFADAHPGATVAAGRPALGFVFDKTTREDVLAWSKANHVECTAPGTGNDLECKRVPSGLLPQGFGGVGLSSLWLNFGGDNTLTSLTTVRRDSSAERISSAFRDVNDSLAHAAGAAAKVTGNAEPAELSLGLLRQASAEYEFRNYYAAARATNMGDAFLMTEEYRSLPN